MDKNDLTLTTYNKIAKDYEKNGLRFSSDEELKKFIQYIKPGGAVLDAGCGFGRELAVFTELGFKTFGIDASQELLKLAHKRALQAAIELVNLRNTLPFESNFFDGVWVRNSLHHLESKDLKNVFLEMRRVLKEKGIFYLEWKEGTGEILTEEEFVAGEKRFYNLYLQNEVADLITHAGFTILEQYTYNWSERYNNKREYSNFISVFAKK